MLMRALARMLAAVSVVPSADAQLGETLDPRLSSRQSCVIDLFDMWDACAPLVVAGMDALEANAGCPSAEPKAALLVDGVAMDAADKGEACCAVFERLDKSDCLCTPDVVSLLPSLPASAANGGFALALGYASTECKIDIKMATFTGECARMPSSLEIAAGNACHNETTCDFGVAIEDKHDILSDGALSDDWTVTGCGLTTTQPTITSAKGGSPARLSMPLSSTSSTMLSLHTVNGFDVRSGATLYFQLKAPEWERGRFEVWLTDSSAPCELHVNLTDAVDDMSAAPGADPAFLENQVLNQMLRPGFTFESTSFGNLSQWTQLALPLSSFALETTRANEVVFQYHPPPYAELTFNSGEPEWDYLWGEDKDAAAPAVDDKRTQGDEFTLWLSDVFISSAEPAGISGASIGVKCRALLPTTRAALAACPPIAHHEWCDTTCVTTVKALVESQKVLDVTLQLCAPLLLELPGAVALLPAVASTANCKKP